MSALGWMKLEREFEKGVKERERERGMMFLCVCVPVCLFNQMPLPVADLAGSIQLVPRGND